jgi:hypothetical protein
MNMKPNIQDAIKVAQKYGIDISLLKESLSWTPSQRFQHHQDALNFIEKNKKAKKNQK